MTQRLSQTRAEKALNRANAPSRQHRSLFGMRHRRDDRPRLVRCRGRDWKKRCVAAVFVDSVRPCRVAAPRGWVSETWEVNDPGLPGKPVGD